MTKLDADDPFKRDLTPGARRTRRWRERITKCARVGKVEANIGIVNALVTAGHLRDGDVSQRGLDRALHRAVEGWAQDVVS